MPRRLRSHLLEPTRKQRDASLRDRCEPSVDQLWHRSGCCCWATSGLHATRRRDLASMGRLTLNVRPAVFRPVRTRSHRPADPGQDRRIKRKGMWIGGPVPLGYEVRDRQLVIEPTEAETVRHIFRRYSELGSVRLLKDEPDRAGIRSKVRIAKNGKRSGGESYSRITIAPADWQGKSCRVLFSNPRESFGTRRAPDCVPGSSRRSP